jgi:hypothetical protein
MLPVLPGVRSPKGSDMTQDTPRADTDAVERQFRKKPVVIEAVQYDSIENVDDGAEPMFSGSFDPPDWITDAIGAEEGQPGSIWIGWVNGIGSLMIGTLEGHHRAEPGDWIIRGIKGELYPCKPDIFSATYEPATLSPAPEATTGVEADKRASGKLNDWIGSALTRPAAADAQGVKREGEPCAFVYCPPGLFRWQGMLCFKSEYSSKPGQQDAYCVDSGEYFWGGTNGDLEARRSLTVTPVFFSTPARPVQVPSREDVANVVAGIIWAADPANGQSGMSLDDDEVCALAALLFPEAGA